MNDQCLMWLFQRDSQTSAFFVNLEFHLKIKHMNLLNFVCDCANSICIDMQIISIVIPVSHNEKVDKLVSLRKLAVS